LGNKAQPCKKNKGSFPQINPGPKNCEALKKFCFLKAKNLPQNSGQNFLPFLGFQALPFPFKNGSLKLPKEEEGTLIKNPLRRVNHSRF